MSDNSNERYEVYEWSGNSGEYCVHDTVGDPVGIVAVAECGDSKENAELVCNALNATATSSEWIPVSERLPEIGENVLCCYVGVYHNRSVIFDGEDFGLVSEPDGHGSQPATHWMPLPEPPK